MRNLFIFIVAIAIPLMVAAQAPDYQFEVLDEPLEHPWSIAFLPDGIMLVTERPGRLRIVSPDGLRPNSVGGVPEMFASGQAGLLDILPAKVIVVQYAD